MPLAHSSKIGGSGNRTPDLLHNKSGWARWRKNALALDLPKIALEDGQFHGGLGVDLECSVWYIGDI